LGWIGKNTLLIHPHYGSYLFLAEVLINKKTGQGPHPIPNYCGNCTRCLNACPTQAFKGSHELDATRCISYWTLEKRGELQLSESDKAKMGTWVAGCDICQEVCPFNLKRSKAELAGSDTLSSPVQDGATELKAWDELFSETEEDYRKRVKNSALNRVKPEEFKRNLRITYENANRQSETHTD
jgi:epoxyqueuosine reductase